jgi:hypothetical protein
VAQCGKLLPGGSVGPKDDPWSAMRKGGFGCPLEQQHRALETKIAEAHTNPSIDDLEIASWKRRKLRVKDALARLKN